MAKTPLTNKLQPQLRSFSFLVRVHAFLRLKSFPFAAVLPFVPHRGSLIDYGAGFGLFSFYLATVSSNRKIFVYDISSAKTTVAKRLLKNFTRVTVARSFAELNKKCPHPQTIILLDVLYLLSHQKKQKLLKQLFWYLKPGGLLILGIVPKEFSLIYYLAWLEEWVMVKLFHLTQAAAQDIEFEDVSWLKKMLIVVGFNKVAFHRLPMIRPFFHKHLLVTAHKPKTRVK